MVLKLTLLSLLTFCGPADDKEDIIDEALYYFKANVFFKSYEVKVSSRLAGKGRPFCRNKKCIYMW